MCGDHMKAFPSLSTRSHIFPNTLFLWSRASYCDQKLFQWDSTVVLWMDGCDVSQCWRTAGVDKSRMYWAQRLLRHVSLGLWITIKGLDVIYETRHCWNNICWHCGLFEQHGDRCTNPLTSTINIMCHHNPWPRSLRFDIRQHICLFATIFLRYKLLIMYMF